MGLRNTSDQDLFRLWAQAMAELKRRKMWANGSPLGWAAEQLVCDRLRLNPTPINEHYRDAISAQERERYQIKGRQSSVGRATINGLQDLNKGNFDYLVVVLYQEDYLTLRQAFKMCHSVVLEVATETARGRNAYGFTLTRDIANREDVQDITKLLA